MAAKKKTVSKTNPVTLKTSANFSFSDSISINPSTQTKEKEKEAEATITNRPTEAYTPEEFAETISNFKSILKTKGKDSLASIFEAIPEVKNETIHLLIENKALEDEFNDQKADFLGFIRKELSNYNIQVKTEINKDIKLKKAYTPQEKFDKMSERNPNLKKLVEKLEMDIGYA